MAMPLLVAARSFENGEISPQLLQVQVYLKTQLKLRRPVSLLEEMHRAGVPPLTAKRLVRNAQRGGALKHFWIALGLTLFMLFIVIVAIGQSKSTDSDYEMLGILGLMLIGAIIYLVIRGIRLVATF